MSKHFAKTKSDDVMLGNFIEISIDPLFLSNFSNEDGMFVYLGSSSEEFQKLRLELWKEVVYLIDTHCTEKQREVLRMIFLEGKTQQKVASETDRHQSTVAKTIIGNDVPSGKKYGGALKKIKKLCSKSERVAEILKKMREICETR